MIKYIVTWVLLKTVPTACPDANKADKFGIASSHYVSCAVFHAEIKKERLKKEFTNKDSATAFYNELMIEAKKSSNIFSDGIDSVILIKSK